VEVELIYFKRNGKFYSRGRYQTKEEHLFDIWYEVRAMRNEGNLPGLVGINDFIISVDVPEHEHNHPHLIVSGVV